jgi:hypothetical protein
MWEVGRYGVEGSGGVMRIMLSEGFSP